jgi:hypothetical protein
MTCWMTVDNTQQLSFFSSEHSDRPMPQKSGWVNKRFFPLRCASVFTALHACTHSFIAQVRRRLCRILVEMASRVTTLSSFSRPPFGSRQGFREHGTGGSRCREEDNVQCSLGDVARIFTQRFFFFLSCRDSLVCACLSYGRAPRLQVRSM